MRITKFMVHRTTAGHVATFDAEIGAVTLRDLTLTRPGREATAWLTLPRLEGTGAWSVGLSDAMRDEIGEAAADVYYACTGLELTYEPRPARAAAA